MLDAQHFRLVMTGVIHRFCFVTDKKQIVFTALANKGRIGQFNRAVLVVDNKARGCFCLKPYIIIVTKWFIFSEQEHVLRSPRLIWYLKVTTK